MTPDNASYYHAAYIVAAVIIAGYLYTLWRRERQLRGRK